MPNARMRGNPAGASDGDASTSVAGRDPRGRSTWLFATGAVLGLFATYGETRTFDFLAVDTKTYVLHPRVVAATIDNLWWLLTHSIGANWTPLSWYSHMLDHRLFGADSGAHHLANVGYHALTVLAVFGCLRHCTGQSDRSMAVALLFAFHPLRVESVAWVVERKDLLSGLFGALSLWAYAAYARRGRVHEYALAWVLFVLSLLAKAMLVTLPCLMLLLDHWPLERFRTSARSGRHVPLRRLLLEKVPFLPPAIFVAYVARYGVDYPTGADDALPVGQRALNAVVSIAEYVRKTFAPADLSFWYPHPYLPVTGGRGLGAVTLATSASLVGLVTAWSLLSLRKRPHLATGWLWFVGTLVPVLGLWFQAGRQGMADRFTYFPSIGLFVAVVWLAAELLHRMLRSARLRRVASGALVAACTVLLAWRSHAEAARWRDTETLYADVLRTNPRNTHVQFLLGELLLQQGERDRGFAHLARAATLTPQWDDLTTGLANRLRDAGRPEEALVWYRRAYEAAPHLNHTRINLAGALAATNRVDEAVDLLREAIRRNPRSVHAHVNLGVTLAAAGRRSEALAEFDRALAIDPNFAAALRLSARVRAEAAAR